MDLVNKIDLIMDSNEQNDFDINIIFPHWISYMDSLKYKMNILESNPGRGASRLCDILMCSTNINLNCYITFVK